MLIIAHLSSFKPRIELIMAGFSCKVILLVALTCVAFAGEDFYGLLGVEKGASVQQIRKAFKKTALSQHPDKNTVSRIFL